MSRDNFYDIRDVQAQLIQARLNVRILEEQLAKAIGKRIDLLAVKEPTPKEHTNSNGALPN